MTDVHITLTIPGVPAPQGSKTAVPQGNKVGIIEGSSATGRRKWRDWRDAVTAAALPHRLPDAYADWTVEISVGFKMPLPKSAPRWKAGMPCGVKPDLDKLVRATLDGLADGRVLPGGDSRVTAFEASMRYCEPDEPSGADVDVWLSAPLTRKDVA